MSRENYYIHFLTRQILVFYFFSGITTVFSQETDTIHLSPLEIGAKKSIGEPIQQSADSLLVASIVSAQVELLLEKFSPLLIKNYGGSGSALVSYQGFSPSQVPVLWNGIPSRAGITGVTDLSLFALSPLQSVAWGNNSLAAQGMTGALSMDQYWNKDSLLFRSVFSSGSFGQVQGNVLLQKLFNQGGIQFFGTASRAENNYTYNNYTILPEQHEQQDNAAYHKIVLSQGWKATNKNQKHNVSGIVEGFYNNRDIPPTLLSPENRSYQQDGGIRSTAKWNYIGNKWKNELKSAWMYSSLYYNDLSLLQESENKGSLWWLSEQVSGEWARICFTEGGVDLGIDRVRSNNYSGTVNEWQINPYVLQKISPASWINITLQLKGIIIQRQHPAITAMAGIDGQPAKKIPFRYFLYARRNVRFPTLNDRYWQPGGNPAIREEKAVNIEAGMQLDKLQIRKNWFFSALVKGYYTTADDLIFWFPGNKVYWSPQNLLKVTSGGIETNFEVRYITETMSISSGIIAQSTIIKNKKAIAINDFSVGKQLLYVPKYTYKIYCLAVYKDFSLLADLQYYSRRYITSDNISYLPGYTLLNLQAGYSRSIKNSHTLQVLFGINNATNNTYEEIAYRPMPGIYFNGSIIYQFSK